MRQETHLQISKSITSSAVRFGNRQLGRVRFINKITCRSPSGAKGFRVFLSSLRKLEKPGKDASILVDDDLRILVLKLRVGHDELRNRQEELRGGQSQH
jgi:hypothetical protein